MFNGIKKSVLICVLTMGTCLFISCGQPTQSSNSIPQAQDPEQKPPQKLEVPPPSGLDPRLPDLSKAVSIDLTDKTGSDLKALAGEIYLPLVGDPKISMAYSNGTGTNLKGSILIAFEDKWGFWGASIPSFEGTGSHSASAFDMIFSDNELVIRTTGILSGDDFDGLIYYRVRRSGENACKKAVTTCDVLDPGLNWGAFTCPYPQPDTLTPCIQYMNVSGADIKILGKFKSKYSPWATVPEGN